MTWLVTGGAGYIGAHVVRAFREAGEAVVVLDSLSSGHAEFVPADVPFVRGTLLDGDLVRHTLREHDVDRRRAPRRLQVRRGLGQPAAADLPAERHGDGDAARADGRRGRAPARVLQLGRDLRDPRRRPRHRGDADAPRVPVRGEQADRGVADRRPGPRRAAARAPSSPTRRCATSTSSARPRRTSTTRARTTSSRSCWGCWPAARRRASTATTTRRRTAPACATTSTWPTWRTATSSRRTPWRRARPLEPVYNLGSGDGVSVRQIMDVAAEVTGIDFTPSVAPRRPGDPARIVASGRARGARPGVGDAALAARHGRERVGGAGEPHPLARAPGAPGSRRAGVPRH